MTPRRIDGLLRERVDNELLVFNQVTAEGHALNETAAAVFDLCDGNTDRTAMAAVLANSFGLPSEPIVVDLALSELRDAGLITVDEVPAGVSRRSVIRALGLSVMAAAGLPVIETMLVSPVAANPQPETTTLPGDSVAPRQLAQSPKPSPKPSPGPSPKPGPHPKPGPRNPPHPPTPNWPRS